MIEIQSLSKHYGSKIVLRNINLTFASGKVYGIVGENGAGKTTFFKCLCGLEKHGGNIQSRFPKPKDQVGFLPTTPYFFPKITGREYLQLLCNARGIKTPELDQRNIFDLPLEQYATTYSTGMKKKLALLGVLMQENQVLILDEPFNGVDIQSNLIITEIIHRLKDLNKTILISSHIFSSLQETCDEIHLLKAGQITRSVQREAFAQLEQEMKDFSIGNSIEKLKLR